MNKISLREYISPAFYNVCNLILKQKHDYFILKGGRATTKSSFIAIIIISFLAAGIFKGHIVIFRKVKDNLKKSVYNQMLWAIYKLKLQHLFKITSHPLEIKYIPTGQTIYFYGLNDDEDVNKIKSAILSPINNTDQPFVSVIWFEEFDQYKNIGIIRSVQQSFIRKKQKTLVFYSFNPPRSRSAWVNEYVEQLILDRDGDYFIHHSTYEQTPTEWIGEQFKKEAEKLKVKDYESYQHEYLGIPVGYGGAVFPNVKAVTFTQENINKYDKVYYGLDFGYSPDPSAFVKVAIYKDDLYILDEIYQSELSTDRLYELIKAKNPKYTIWADSQANRTINDLRKKGLGNIVPVKKGPDSVHHGINFIRHFDNIYIDKNRTPYTYKEFINYEYKQDKNGEYISDYPDKNNHSIDAVRYALEQIMLKQNIQFVNMTPLF